MNEDHYDLTPEQIDEVQRAYQQCVQNDAAECHIVGTHWTLIAVLRQCGIPVNSKEDALRIAAEVAG